MSTSFEQLEIKFKEKFPLARFNLNSEDGIWIYAAPKELTYNDSIHYELIQRGELFFVEFHIEGNEYPNYIKRIRDCFDKDENLRNYHFFTYYSSKYWQTRTPVFSVEDFQRDIDALVSLVESALGVTMPEVDENKQESSGVQIYNHVTADKLLELNLQIPAYQRPYCWDEKNIRDFLGDIDLHQKSSKQICYHLGSIILKKKEENAFDVIDGQQRLTTLAIFYRKIAAPSLLNSCKMFTAQEIRNIRQAARLLQSTCFEVDLKRIEFSVVVLGEEQIEDLAYTFFSNSNSTGKKLSDYDLLKTHHLRYITTDGAAERHSSNWHNMEKSGTMDVVLHMMLYRLRQWNCNAPFFIDASSRESRDIFQHYKSVDSLKNFSGFSHQTPRFNSLLSGGTEFFSFVGNYSKKYEEYTACQPIQQLELYLKHHSNGVLCAGIKAITFLFFCKFGDMYLKEALFLIAYRVSELRNETQLRGSYLGTKPIFGEITRLLDQVTSDSQFFALLSNPKKRYTETNQGKTAQCYWVALHELLNKISEGSFELDSSNFINKEE